MRSLVLLTVLAIACGCAGTPTATSTPTAGSPTASAPATTASPAGTGVSADALCFLTVEDWHAFNYVTGAQPTVTSDAPGTALCQYASGLFLEVYTHEEPSEASETFETILDNVPFDEQVDLNLPGAEQVVFDPDTGDGHAGIAVRSGRLVFTISGLARESAQAELLTLAGLVLQRAADLV